MQRCTTRTLPAFTPAGCSYIRPDWLRPPDQALCKKATHGLKATRICPQLSHQDVDGVTDRLAMSKAFFYKQRLDSECIKSGLSNLLAGYPVLAGRLGKLAKTGQAYVYLTNSGVPFRETQLAATSNCFEAGKLDMHRSHAGLPIWIEVNQHVLDDGITCSIAALSTFACLYVATTCSRTRATLCRSNSPVVNACSKH